LKPRNIFESIAERCLKMFLQHLKPQ